MPNKITNLGEDWPFPTITYSYKSGSRNFFEVCERVFDEQLNVLPPRKFESTPGYITFRVSEEWDTIDGEPIHTLFICLHEESGNRFFCKMERMRKSNAECMMDLTRDLYN